jgi:hypothetical protein
VSFVAKAVRAQIASKAVDPASVVSIIREVGAQVQKLRVDYGSMSFTTALDITEAVIIEVAKGKDGLHGTDDDLIAPKVVDMVKLFTSDGIVRDFAALALDSIRSGPSGICRFLPCFK